MFKLTNKKILITGASSGIGKETAVLISKCGANTIITGRNEQKLKNTFKKLDGKNNSYFIADLTDIKQIEQLIQELPLLDGLVHCAGITSHLPAQFINSEKISEMFKINYEAPVLITSNLIRKKKLKNNSSLIFLSSIATKYPYFGGSLYISSKSALEAYSKVLSLELSKKGIRSNCLSPTFVKTPMVEGTEKKVSKQAIDNLEKIHLLGFGETTDVAQTIIFFLSDASRWITGTNLILGGG